jgi:glycosyltransferase involved in cell wall biosynthesis
VRPGENGFLTDFKDASAAAATLRRARDLGEARGAFSAAARRTAEAYGWEAVVEDLERTYAETLRGA